MLFVTRNKDRVSGGDTDPLVVVKNLAFACVKKNLVLPGMGMTRCMSSWGKIKTAHAEIVCAVDAANNHPARHPPSDLGIKMHGLCGRCWHDFHFILPFRRGARPDQ